MSPKVARHSNNAIKIFIKFKWGKCGKGRDENREGEEIRIMYLLGGIFQQLNESSNIWNISGYLVTIKLGDFTRTEVISAALVLHH